MPSAPSWTDALADRVLSASAARIQIAPLTREGPALSERDAYAVAEAVTKKRMARGETPVGWKIGFTNRALWQQYDVQAPLWGRVYDTTLIAVAPGERALCAVADLLEPRIEPEIVLRLARPPRPDMDEATLLSCIDGVAHGFEVVQSIFPGWRFKAADGIAAYGLHGRLYCGPFVAPDHAGWPAILRTLTVTLRRNGVDVARGVGANVLGSPLAALAHFVEGLRAISGMTPMPGEIVTTGTITDALLVAPGELWSTEISGAPLAGLALDIA